MSQNPSPTETPAQPSSILMAWVVALLAPAFLAATAGDLGMARMVAAETVASYRARSNADLLAVAQVVAHSLAALAALGRSMAADVPEAMAVRLCASANACTRSAERAQRRLDGDGPARKPRQHATPAPAPKAADVWTEEDERNEADTLLLVASAQARLDEVTARMAAAEPVGAHGLAQPGAGAPVGRAAAFAAALNRSNGFPAGAAASAAQASPPAHPGQAR